MYYDFPKERPLKNVLLLQFAITAAITINYDEYDDDDSYAYD